MARAGGGSVCVDVAARVREQRCQAVPDGVAALVESGCNPARSSVFRAAGVYGLHYYDPVLGDVWRDAVREHGFSPDP